MYINQYTEESRKNERKKYQLSLDRKKIFITKGGKTYNLYDYIQENREDTEIYPTLEKYGNIDRMQKETNPKMIYADVSNALDLRGMFEQDKKLQTIFENLPSNERNIFNNDFYQFRENGLQYYEAKAKAEIEKANQIRQRIEEQRNKPQKVEIVNKEEK